MGCPSVTTLADLAHGRLSERESGRLQSHVASCQDCKAQSVRVRRITDTLRTIAETDPPSLSSPSMARLEATLRWTRIEPEPEKRRFSLLGVKPAYLVAAAAAVVFATTAGGTVALRRRAAREELARLTRKNVPTATEAKVASAADKATPAAPRSETLRGIVTLVSGDVRVVRAGAATSEGAQAGTGAALGGVRVKASEPIAAGDRLITAPGARVAFQWGEGSGALLRGGSELELGHLESRAQELLLARGSVAVRVGPHQPGESLRVVSPDHTVTVHGTWFLVGAEARGTKVEVLEGVVEVGARVGDPTSTKLRAPSTGFFQSHRGAPDAERALSGKEAAELRAATEMGILPWGGADSLLETSGLLAIHSNPPAQLVVDGIPFGSTPLDIRRLRERHLIELTRPGFAPLRRWISVGEKAEVDMNLHAGVARQHEDEVNPAEAQQMVASRRRQVSTCYERSLKRDPTLAGTVTLMLRVGPAGQVLSTRVTDDTLKSVDVTECLRRETAGWLFRTMRNASVAYPFVFRAP